MRRHARQTHNGNPPGRFRAYGTIWNTRTLPVEPGPKPRSTSTKSCNLNTRSFHRGKSMTRFAKFCSITLAAALCLTQPTEWNRAPALAAADDEADPTGPVQREHHPGASDLYDKVRFRRAVQGYQPALSFGYNSRRARTVCSVLA
ncbi:hypothetical protein F2981_31505 (plasmid) [Sinorhizobium meliloti]|nr:hypothetical protein [Sinorhizobium meliloti]